jgi:hypothetical protein
MFFFDLFCGGIVSYFLAETQWAPMLGVSKNADKFPEHKRMECESVQVRGTDDARGDRISKRLLSLQKL